jgi:hypothetical protein
MKEEGEEDDEEEEDVIVGRRSSLHSLRVAKSADLSDFC